MSIQFADRKKQFVCSFTCAVLLSMFGGMVPLATAHADDGFHSIFDGKTLAGWDGNRKFWHVEDGAITGQTTKRNPTKGNTFLIWRGAKPLPKGIVANFELKLEYKIIGGNSGIQYRSFELPDQKWVIGGYQADIEAGDTYSGILYSEKARGVLALRGQKTVVGKDGKPKVVEQFGNSKEIQAKIKKEDWNSYHIIARGNHLIHTINGVKTIEVTDNDIAGAKRQAASGLLALQVHAGPPMKVQFRNIRIKVLNGGKDQSRAVPARNVAKKRIALIAGKKSHGYGAHEHRAGCLLLAKALNESGLPIKAEVYTGGWPKDASVLNDADTIVIYADGGGRHPFNAHIEELDTLMKKGVGMVCIHYGVEVPKGKSGNAFLDWTGGYFEANWSVNPHWTAKYKKFPKHPIANGVKPFSINDEWYYHMRFRSPPSTEGQADGVIPILTDLPPASTLKRPDGPHSGNKFVRQAVANGESQHMAWARQRSDGGRGFGFTGGHVHWNWGNDDFRKLVLNAIVWTARAKVPKDGVPSKPFTVKDLMANQDYPAPDGFNGKRIQAMLNQWNRKSVAKN